VNARARQTEVFCFFFKKKKACFFEKKQQKTFASLEARRQQRAGVTA